MYSRTRLATRATTPKQLFASATAAVLTAAACLCATLTPVQAAPPALPGTILDASHSGIPAGRVPAPADSYLKYKVYNLNQLLNQVQSDPAMLRLYARHFGRSQNRIISYMRSDLVESYIPVTTKYPVYCVRPNGQIYSVTQTFKQGTKVFALRNGQPVLKWVCGNPLSRTLPPVETRYVKTPRIPTTIVKPSVEELISDTEDLVIPSELETPILQAAVPTTLAAAGIAASPVFSGGSGSFNFGTAGLVAAAVATPFLIRTGSSSSSSPLSGSTPNIPVVPGGGTTPVTPVGPTPVPEPGIAPFGLALFLVGSGFMMRRQVASKCKSAD